VKNVKKSHQHIFTIIPVYLQFKLQYFTIKKLKFGLSIKKVVLSSHLVKRCKKQMIICTVKNTFYLCPLFAENPKKGWNRLKRAEN
jgi:hypothetical protein